MEHWNFNTLKNIVSNVIDYRGKTPLKLGGEWGDNIQGNYRALSAKNVKTGRIVQQSEIRYVDPVLYKKWMKQEINRGDILITSEAPFGEIFYWDSDEKIVLSQRLFAVSIDKKYYDKYIYFYMTSQAFQGELRSRSTGSTVEGLRQPALMKCGIFYPEYDNQVKIGDLLYTYNRLIENNTKRIKLLEKAAEELYKEWFVRFRFPGYENAEFEHGIPKGWKIGKLFELCEFKRGKNITSDEMIEGIYPVVSAGIEPSGYHNRFNVDGYSITISASGANAGYIKFNKTKIWAADCSYVSSASTKNIYYIYELLNNLRAVITNLQVGAAQPHVYSKDVNKIKLLIPSDEIIFKANNKLQILHKKIMLLEKANQNLSKQRDLLLPRLMSGKLEVK